MAVQIYRRVRGGPRSGQKLTKAMAWTRDAHTGLFHIAQGRAMTARAVLNTADRRTGTSRIVMERVGPDVYVTLTDERGQGAANIIEFGRRPLSQDSTPSYAVAPLGHAFGFPQTGRGGPR